MYVAVEDLKPIDPDITAAFAWVMGTLAVILLGMIIVYSVRIFIRYIRRSEKQRSITMNAIWYDNVEAVLHCGHNTIRIEPNSFEHFVCKIIFNAPNKYTKDLDIFDEADEAKGVKETKRGVEQAVRRLNKKTKTMGLREDLFKRSKERTTVNEEYRNRIVIN